MSTIGGVVLAAGAGRRLGTPKAMLRLQDGRTLGSIAVDLLRRSEIAPIRVVIGAQADVVRRSADLSAADEVVVNHDWATGMASSLRVGLQGLAADAVVVTLVDTPGVTPDVVERLTHAWRLGAVAAVATFSGSARTPVVLDSSVWAEVSDSVTGDQGARGWLRANADRVAEIECADLVDWSDIDTPADLDGFQYRS